MKKSFFIGMIFVMQLSFPSFLHAQVPHVMHYQSLVYDQDGNFIEDGSKNLVFNIVNADGELLYSEEQEVHIKDGLLSTLIGSGKNLQTQEINLLGLPLDLFQSEEDRFLEVNLEGAPPTSQLHISSVPFAYVSEYTTSVAPAVLGVEHFSAGGLLALQSALTTGITQNLDAVENQVESTSQTVNTHTTQIADINTRLGDLNQTVNLNGNIDDDIQLFSGVLSNNGVASVLGNFTASTQCHYLLSLSNSGPEFADGGLKFTTSGSWEGNNLRVRCDLRNPSYLYQCQVSYLIICKK
ncbi:MAG: hypothetical protein COV43_01050 [Deltaproteobacteria bacterium CG11_big_fil_rev_8_21_14_0_20_42_23]|nr:MAG: hypothetical protein COV43_01050 [Deltaproteobacteria bacterium CG11_big_fil_rev_8_21_14_0_20_42_23]PJC63561.1 MAG: hypothetical protein CO021_08940 [Deltaproteobacteria bacterium CG_4_9_14_0_2_um_filter_42_21]